MRIRGLNPLSLQHLSPLFALPLQGPINQSLPTLTSLLWCSRNNPEEEEGEKEDDISHSDSTTSQEGGRAGNPPKGPFIKDVRTVGGNVTLSLYVDQFKMRTRWRGCRVRNPKTAFNDGTKREIEKKSILSRHSIGGLIWRSTRCLAKIASQKTSARHDRIKE